MAAEKPKTGERFNPWRGACGFYVPDAVGRQRRLPDHEGKHREVTDGHKRLYERLVRIAGRQGKCWPSQIGLAEFLGKSDRQVRSDLDALESFRLIDRDRKKGQHRHSVYFFLWHPIFDEFERKPTSVETPEGEFEDQVLNGSPLPLKPDLNGSPQPFKKDGSEIRTEVAGNLNGSAASFERKRASDEFSKNSVKEFSHPPQRSFSAPRSADDEDDSHSSNNGNGADTHPVVEVVGPVQHAEDDIRNFGQLMQESIVQGQGTAIEQTIARYTGTLPIAPTPELIRQVLACAPDWSVDEVWQALKANAVESPSKPKSYRWFLKVVGDVYKRRNGIPPTLPEPPPEHVTETEAWTKADEWREEYSDEHRAQDLRWRAIYSTRMRGTLAPEELTEFDFGLYKYFSLGTNDTREFILEQLESDIPWRDVQRDLATKHITLLEEHQVIQ